MATTDRDASHGVEFVQKPGAGSKLLAFLGVVISVLYLLNLSGGFIEVPDNLPLVGNVDEVFFSGLLFASLSKLGIDVLGITRGRRPVRPE